MTSTQTARTRLAPTFVLVKRVLRVTVKHVKVKLKRNMEPYGKHPNVTYWSKNFYSAAYDPHPLISNGQLITNKKIFSLFYAGVSVRLLGFRLGTNFLIVFFFFNFNFFYFLF